MDFGAIGSAWAVLRRTIAELPDGVIAGIIVALATLLALATHRAAIALLRRTAACGPYLASMLARMEGLLRLAFVLLFLNVAVAAAPIEPPFGAIIAHALQLAFIAFMGWMVLTATGIAADLYMRRFDTTAPDNLLARKHLTQVRVIRGTLNTLIVTVTIAAALMTFSAVRQYGISLFASAGIAGIVAGLAARPMLSNLIAGIQIAISQPIRIEDAVVVENEFGHVEEINSTYVVVRLWDQRHMIVPLSYFIEKPFQNWTRETGELIGSVIIHADYSVPVQRMGNVPINVEIGEAALLALSR